MSPRTLTGAGDPGGRFVGISISFNLKPPNFLLHLLFINICVNEKMISLYILLAFINGATDVLAN